MRIGEGKIHTRAHTQMYSRISGVELTARVLKELLSAQATSVRLTPSVSAGGLIKKDKNRNVEECNKQTDSRTSSV